MLIGFLTNDTKGQSKVLSEIEAVCSQRQVRSLNIFPTSTWVRVEGNKISIYDKQGELTPDIMVNALASPAGLGLTIAEAFSKQGVPVINRPEAWRNARIKPLTNLAFATNHIPQPSTVFSHGFPVSSTGFLANLAFPLVTKPWRGAQGNGIVLHHTLEQLTRHFAAHEREAAYLQQFIKHNHRHLRVIVIGDEVVGAIYRIHHRGQAITGMFTGYGAPLPCKLNSELKDLSHKAVKSLGLDLGGVDIIDGEDGYVVLEVNAWPAGYKDFRTATGISIADRLLDYLATRTKEG